MKTLALTLILSVLLHQALSASITGNEMMNSADGLTLQQTENSRVQEYFIRSKRHTVLSTCVYCCKCCRSKECVYCCRT